MHCIAGDADSIPRLGKSPRGGRGNPLQYSCLENPMDRGAWRAAESRTRAKRMSTSTDTWANTSRILFSFPSLPDRRGKLKHRENLPQSWTRCKDPLALSKAERPTRAGGDSEQLTSDWHAGDSPSALTWPQILPSVRFKYRVSVSTAKEDPYAKTSLSC